LLGRYASHFGVPQGWHREAVLLVAKLQALDNKNLIHRGLEEYGRLLKTIDILTYLSDKPYRRRIGRMLNKGEAVPSLAVKSPMGSWGS
jgi:TnpA family transposase